MANFSNTIKTVIDVSTDKATAGVKSFRQSIGEAEGATGKLKAGFGQAGDFIKANAANVAAVAGTALIGFAAKAVGEFQDLALEAGKMADTLGITTEAASKWIEVAGDIGASGEDVTKAMAKMEREVAKNPAQFDALGVSIARTNTGAVDANETFLRTIEALKKIENPTARQEAANKLLGKSWGNLAELVNGDVREAFDSVSESKIIDPAEVERAREFRDAWDELKGKLEDFTIEVGGKVVPALTSLVDFVGDVGDAVSGLEGPLEFAAQAFEDAFGHGGDMADRLIAEHKAAQEEISGTGVAAQTYADRLLGLARRYQGVERDAGPAAEAIGATGDAAIVAKGKLEQLNAEWDALTGRLTDQGAWNNVTDSFEEVGEAGVEAMEAADEAARLTTEAMKSGSAESAAAAEEAWARSHDATNRARDAVLSNKQAVMDYAREVLGLPAERATQILAMLDAGEVERVEEMLAILTRNRNVSVSIVAKGGVGFDGGLSGKRAAGGPTAAGGLYEVNENGSELLTENGRTYLMAGSNGMVTPLGNSASGGRASGGGGLNVTINAPVVDASAARWMLGMLQNLVQTHGVTSVHDALGLGGLT